MSYRWLVAYARFPATPRRLLTERQQEVLEYLYESRNVAGLLPSTREIQEHFGFASQTAAVDVLRALERKGVLRRLPGVARGIILNEPALAYTKVVCIPLHGVIATGYAHDSAELDGEFLRVDAAAIGLDSATGSFALRVHGDSLDE